LSTTNISSFTCAVYLLYSYLLGNWVLESVQPSLRKLLLYVNPHVTSVG